MANPLPASSHYSELVLPVWIPELLDLQQIPIWVPEEEMVDIKILVVFWRSKHIHSPAH